MSAWTYREAPVDVGHLGVQVETEDQEEDARHHEGTAADELKEVDASTGRTHHDCLYADESNKWQDLKMTERHELNERSRSDGILTAL